MKKIARFSAFVMLAITLAACATSGKKISDADVSTLQKGVTTYDVALAKFGKPSNVMVNSDGKRTVEYTYVHTQVDGKTFIPFAGAFIGGANSESQTLTLTFNKSNVLEEYATSQGQTNVSNH
ncbi:MAG TPA: hypothetical protein VK558_00200 [Patescibacteria group bacterium]|nr:hypothetical protein [Patescibacteria group bacterium]